MSTTTTEPEYYSVTATVTDRWGGVETVELGSQQGWAVRDGAALAPWKRMIRAQVLADRTMDPRGWRVTFAFAPLED